MRNQHRELLEQVADPEQREFIEAILDLEPKVVLTVEDGELVLKGIGLRQPLDPS